MRKWDVRASYVISSNTNCTKQPYFRFLSAGFYMTVNTHWSLKQCVSHREASPKTLPASKWRSQVCLWGIHADLGSVLKQFLVMMWVLSLDWGLFLCPTVCQSASVCRAVFAQQHPQDFSCTSTNVHLRGENRNSITASGHRNLSPLVPTSFMSPWKQEGITDKIRAITFLHFYWFFFFFLFFYFFIQTRFQQIYTWKKSAGLWTIKKSSSSPRKYCLSRSTKNGNVWKSIIVMVATMIANIHIM